MQPTQAVRPSGPETGELSDRERDLRDFLEHAAVPLHWAAEDGTILWANQAELRLAGYARQEYVNHNIVEFYIDQPVILDILRRLKDDEVITNCEARLRCKDGSPEAGP